jgi:hypothetical protein
VAVTLQHERDNVYRLEISGTLRKTDLDAVQRSAAAEIQRTGKIRLLIVLKAFEGWASDANWRDLSFYIQHGGDIERIAIVGDERWRGEALMFTAADLRAALVEFFPMGHMTSALTWIAA